MKKLMAILAMLLLAATPVMAEMPADLPAAPEMVLVPVEILPQSESQLAMADAITAAEATLPALPADCLTRAELVRMSDGSCQWIVTIFDLATFADGWCIAVDAASGEVLGADVTDSGYFHTISQRWQMVKGVEALWSLQDKLLFDTLYTMQSNYGLPMEGDMSQTEALLTAMQALGLNSPADFDIGYGYIMGMGDGGVNGMWEVYFVQSGELVYKVNLDAVNGEIYLIEPDVEGNG